MARCPDAQLKGANLCRAQIASTNIYDINAYTVLEDPLSDAAAAGISALQPGTPAPGSKSSLMARWLGAAWFHTGCFDAKATCLLHREVRLAPTVYCIKAAAVFYIPLGAVRACGTRNADTLDTGEAIDRPQPILERCMPQSIGRLQKRSTTSVAPFDQSLCHCSTSELRHVRGVAPSLAHAAAQVCEGKEEALALVLPKPCQFSRGRCRKLRSTQPQEPGNTRLRGPILLALVTSGLASFHALHAALAALQDGLPQTNQGHRMLASCAKTKQDVYNVPAGCLRR